MEYYFVNHIWQVRDTKNFLGNKITYQSRLELKFIDFCNENKIEILDGPKIPYFWNNKFRTYSIDFYVPKIDTLIEIKSMHKFHIKDIESGKFQAKCDAANKLVDIKKYSNFIVLYDFDMTDEWKNMFKKQLSVV